MDYLKLANCEMKAIVDPSDYLWAKDKKWRITKDGYVVTATNTKLHRLVNKTPKGSYTDHINGNKLDNRRNNLRTCTSSENMCNIPKRSTNTSGYKGVVFDKRWGRWKAQITKNYKYYHIGSFDTPKEAYFAYKKKAEELHGDFACG